MNRFALASVALIAATPPAGAQEAAFIFQVPVEVSDLQPEVMGIHVTCLTAAAGFENQISPNGLLNIVVGSLKPSTVHYMSSILVVPNADGAYSGTVTVAVPAFNGMSEPTDAQMMAHTSWACGLVLRMPEQTYGLPTEDSSANGAYRVQAGATSFVSGTITQGG